MADASSTAPVAPARLTRVYSIDALRGFVMFTMIFVNDLAGAPRKIVPDWMAHFSDRHDHGSGMTFVDLVFPAFLFIVGMSIPFALGARLAKGEPLWKTIFHITTRTLFLLFIGILMVNETPDSAQMGWSGPLWCTLMYLSAIFAFCEISGSREKTAPAANNRQNRRIVSLTLRCLGFASLLWLALAFRDKTGRGIVSFHPFSIHTEWYGILGLIGWAYLIGAIVFLLFRTNRTALLGSAVILMCFYPAERHGAFEGFWLSRYVGIGETLGSQAAITVAGILLATILITPHTAGVRSRTYFTLLFIAASAALAWLVNGLYGISKNSATPSWCLWACATTAAFWLVFYYLCDVHPIRAVAGPLAVAGQNVLLAYLISEMLPSTIDILHLGDFYDSLCRPHLFNAVARSIGCSIFVLCVTAGLNRLSFRLKL